MEQWHTGVGGRGMLQCAKPEMCDLEHHCAQV